jgi:hypothetical protein
MRRSARSRRPTLASRLPCGPACISCAALAFSRSSPHSHWGAPPPDPTNRRARHAHLRSLRAMRASAGHSSRRIAVRAIRPTRATVTVRRLDSTSTPSPRSLAMRSRSTRSQRLAHAPTTPICRTCPGRCAHLRAMLRVPCSASSWRAKRRCGRDRPKRETARQGRAVRRSAIALATSSSCRPAPGSRRRPRHRSS